LEAKADTSFLVSLYSLDANSVAAATIVKASVGDRFVTILGELEVIKAFALLVFRKEVTAAQAQSSIREFEQDLQDGVFQLRGIPDTVFERARTTDILQVAAALELGVDYLYSFDQHQRKLAQSIRLKSN
jgi:predicted nucleic acid-binding protein